MEVKHIQREGMLAEIISERNLMVLDLNQQLANEKQQHEILRGEHEQMKADLQRQVDDLQRKVDAIQGDPQPGETIHD